MVTLKAGRKFIEHKANGLVKDVFNNTQTMDKLQGMSLTACISTLLCHRLAKAQSLLRIIRSSGVLYTVLHCTATASLASQADIRQLSSDQAYMLCIAWL